MFLLNFGEHMLKTVQAFSIFSLFFFSSLFAEYYSQFKQDKYVNETFFKNKKNGIFVDIGAYDGITINNSLYFEKNLGWSGICIEPIPEVFEKLSKTRKCLCYNNCISNTNETVSFLVTHGTVENIEMLSGIIDKYDPQHIGRINSELRQCEGFTEVLKIQAIRLNDLLDEQGLYHIDFLSLDTEGGELQILKSIDYDRFDIDVITVENNYSSIEFRQFLRSKGYRFVTALGCDEIYKKNQG